jgi:WD40 repeat protein
MQVMTGSGGYDPDALPIPGPPQPPIDNVIRIFDVESGKEVSKFEGHTDRVIAVVFAGDHVLSASVDRTIRVWDAKTGKELRKITVEDTHQVMAAAISADGGRALATNAAQRVKLFDTESGKQLQNIENGRSMVWCAAFSADGKLAVTGTGYQNDVKDGKLTYFDTKVWLWDLSTGKLIRAFDGHETPVMAVAFSPDGRQIISGSGAPYFSKPIGALKEVATDNSVRVWDIATGKELQKYAGHTEIVRGLAVASEGGTFASTSEDKTIRIWKLPK